MCSNMLWEMALLWFVEENRTELRELKQKKKINGNETTKIIILWGKCTKKIIKLTIKLYYFEFIPALVLLYGVYYMVMMSGHSFVWPAKFARIWWFVHWSSGWNCGLCETQKSKLWKLIIMKWRKKDFQVKI